MPRRTIARRRPAGWLALLIAAVVSVAPGSAQVLTSTQVARTPAAGTRLTTDGTDAKAGPLIPPTPAGKALRAWIDAFNSADSVRVAAYARNYEAGLDIAEERGFREHTGGFDLIGIERSTPQQIEFVVRERKSPMTAYGAIAMSTDEPMRVGMRRFQPLGPQVTTAMIRVDAATRARTIAAVVELLDTFYVSAPLATVVADSLRGRSARGAYREHVNGVSFAMRLDDDLAELTRDKHLHVMYSVPALPSGSSAVAGESSPVQALETATRERRERLEAMNCGFVKAEVMSGNVGYVKFDMFADPELCGPTASAAMTFVAGTRALILDLRDNGGGDPAMVSYIASYLFDTRTHLNDLWTRRTAATQEFWTRDSTPGRRFGGTKPVVVLTSSRTFSGGEEFAYDLQQLHRATIVGETTGGGAHPMSSHRIDEHFTISVPFARPINPSTRTNWEGVGVVPDVKVPATDALAAALRRLQQSP